MVRRIQCWGGFRVGYAFPRGTVGTRKVGDNLGHPGNGSSNSVLGRIPGRVCIPTGGRGNEE